FTVPVAFEPFSMARIVAEVLSESGRTMFRTAETEKYAHVTYFFNGGVEEPFPGEERELVPSPKVATYDLQPEMSAPEVTEKLAARIRAGGAALFVCNYANGDMVGHTGNFEAAVEAMEVIDRSLAAVHHACEESGVVLCITADHGNAEEMLAEGPENGPSTQHSLCPVPFIVCDPALKLRQVPLATLSNVAPTVLQLMGLPVPPQMTSEGLLG
ncbi:MAG TPA: 2,3-bisphosphoglycerate-independent phosphoglycerate mutase, partial [bacterium]|nr:2,3-bisphosphoglycerate-independent phosphoglycerate mutase [bacterium]